MDPTSQARLDYKREHLRRQEEIVRAEREREREWRQSMGIPSLSPAAPPIIRARREQNQDAHVGEREIARDLAVPLVDFEVRRDIQDPPFVLSSQAAYENALYDLILSLFRSANASQSFSLLQESLSYTLRLGIEIDLELSDFCKFHAWHLAKCRRDLPREQVVALESGIFPFTTNQETSMDSLVTAYVAIAEWKQNPSVSFLLIVLLVMMHQKNDRRISANKVQDFVRTERGVALEPVSMLLLELVQGNALFRERQEEQLQRLITIIDLRNPMILPALVHPGPLRQTYYSPSASGSVKEARVLLQIFEEDFENTTGARETLVARFGRWPHLIDPTGNEKKETTDYRGTPDSAAYAVQQAEDYRL